jgi:ribose-phosphate pyrophosphokinase
LTKILLLSGNANPPLSDQIAKLLKIPLAKAFVGQFSDGESRIEIQDPLAGQDVFIIQPTSNPTNHHLIELLLIADAAHRAQAKRVTAVIPYLGYARQDKRLNAHQVPISAKVVADLLTTVGIQRILTIELHSEQTEALFSIPVENLSSSTVFKEDILKKGFSNTIVITPDMGGSVRARAFAKQFSDTEIAIIDKRRLSPNKTHEMNLIGQVKDKNCIIIDDMVDTAGTLCLAAATLKEQGAKKVVAYVTHPVLSGNAVAAIDSSVLDDLVVTDTILLSDKAKKCARIRVLSIAKMIADAIQKMNNLN